MGESGRSAVGEQLRAWRLARGRTQLSLAVAAGTTPRHLSFVENGRSRPGPGLLSRLASELELPAAAADLLRHAAGLPAKGPQPEVAADSWTRTIAGLLSGHEPLPACAVDHLGCVREANAAYLRLVPDAIELSAEEQVDRFFGASGRRWIANWAEVAWREADRRLHRAQRSGDAQAVALYLRAVEHLDGVARPAADATTQTSTVHLMVGESETIALSAIVLLPDSASGVRDHEFRVELTVPADEPAHRWLIRNSAAS